jgi:adenylate cyclase
MPLLFKYKPRLRPSILTAFVVLTVPVFAAIIAVTYVSNDRTARASAAALIDRFRLDAIENIQDDINPIKSLVRAAAALGDQVPDFYYGDRSIPYFHATLRHSDKIVSAYAGLVDGSFRQSRRVETSVRVFNEFPPKGSVYASRFVEPGKGPPTIDRYVFFDGEGRNLGEQSAPTSYDPRTRGWYRHTVTAGRLYVTEPDVFAALGLIGFTIAQPFFENGKLLGVVAIDITLDGLSQYLAQRKISPGTLSYLLDQQGRVIAASDGSRTYASDQGQLELRHISALDNDLPSQAFRARPREASTEHLLYAFHHAGREYEASLSALPDDFGRRWQLFVVTPIDDFTGAFTQHNNRLLIFGVLALVVQVVIIYLLSSVISRPLERIAAGMDDIRELEPGERPHIDSPIREIDTLSRAMDTLDHALKSFSAFVPVGLVRQLLASEQKLELGGNSRFLTVFFSDIEAFSTLSEDMPAREMLLRISAYLELVTRVIDEEKGTIDKFMGDGVMAFWGAPVLLDDHVWRACVAALRIRQGMAAINAQWTEKGQKPLRVRIGIHADAVLVGNIGSMQRMSYTVLGDGVNVASRLEGINKEYGTDICISHSVYREVGERLCVRPIDDVAVKGRRSKIPIYEVLGALSEPEFQPDPDTLRLCRMTRAAYEAMVAGDAPLALQRYREVAHAFPGDPVAAAMIERLSST